MSHFMMTCTSGTYYVRLGDAQHEEGEMQKESKLGSQVWGHMPAIPELRRLRERLPIQGWPEL